MTIKKAREVIVKAFKDDPGFRDTYVANVACVLLDSGIKDFRNDEVRNQVADQILKRILS
jgi:hypothetical protein